MVFKKLRRYREENQKGAVARNVWGFSSLGLQS